MVAGIKMKHSQMPHGGGQVSQLQGDHTFLNDLELLLEALKEFQEWLRDNFPDGFVIRRISGQQGDRGSERFAGGTASQLDFVAAVYDTASHVRQLEATLYVTAHVLADFIDSVCYAHKEQRLGIILSDLRSILERLAHIRFLSKVIEKTQGEKPTTKISHPFLDTFELQKHARKALYGTRTDWNAIVEQELRDIDLKKMASKTVRQELLGDYDAEQILSKIDALNKILPGSRACYELLCEFAHPNVGDLAASTQEYESRSDRFGVVHITRTIGTGLLSKKSNANFAINVSKVFRILVEIVDASKSDFGSLKLTVAEMVRLLRSYSEQVIKKNRKNFFRSDDPCLCLSGRTMGKCCGKKLLWVR
jgi:hypothetical protein